MDEKLKEEEEVNTKIVEKIIGESLLQAKQYLISQGYTSGQALDALQRILFGAAYDLD